MALSDVFGIIKSWGGIELAALSHEGLLYDFIGRREEAEALAAMAPSLLNDVKKSIRGSEYVLTGSAKSATFTYGGGDFTLVIRGERNVVSSYVDVILRLISGNTIKCPSCGTELDSEVITCPSCGLKYPFTLPSCPKCGTGSVYRRCPKCGSLITYRGLKVVKDKTPAVVFSATALAILGLGALIGNLIIGLVGAAIVGSVGAIMWFAAPVLTVSRG